MSFLSDRLNVSSDHSPIINSMLCEQSVISMSRHAIEVEHISKHVFENIPNDFGDVLRQSETDFSEEKMTLAMFHCNLKTDFGMKRCFTAI